MTVTVLSGGTNIFLRYLTRFVLGGLLILAVLTLWVGWLVRDQHLTTYSLLVNLAAGFVTVFVGTLIALIIARAKLKDAALPILKLIQQLERDGRISQPAARKSVIAAVAVLSERNIRSAVPPDSTIKPETSKCPVCRLDVELNPKKRCKHCSLPDALWQNKELIEAASTQRE